MASKKTKATHTNGRTKKGVAYNPNHNTLEYVRKLQPHIDQARLCENYYFKFDEHQNAQTIKGGQGGFDSKKHEKKLYEIYFGEGIEARNQRYIKSGHRERCKDINEIYTDPKTAPLETITQIGNYSSEMSASERGKILLNAWRDYTKEMMAQFGEFMKPLSASYHAEEKVPHIHSRVVLGATDKFGHFVPNQSLALEMMGFERPNPDKPVSRYNNALISFTDHCRERFYYHCERYGLEIDREVTSQSRRQYELEQYRLDQIKKEREAEERKLETTRETVKIEEQMLNEAHKEVNVRKYGTIEAEPEKKSLSGKVKEEAKPHRTIVATEDLEDLQQQARYNRVQEYNKKTMADIERAMNTDETYQELQQQLLEERTRANQNAIELRKEREARVKAECYIKEKGLGQAYEQHQIELNHEHSHGHRRR